MNRFHSWQPPAAAALALWLSCQPLAAFPPAPHHTLFGLVRNQWGDPLNAPAARIILETPSGPSLATPLVVGRNPAMNYQLEVPMDAGIAPDLYKPSALKPFLPFRLKVLIGQTVYLPIEMAADYAQMGQPARSTRLDLTLGQDTDGDGLPDAWEQALIAALGGNLSLADINGHDDSDADGISNLDEYLAGTYAFDPAEGFSLALLGFTEEASVLEFLALRDRTYSLQASADLRTWTPVAFRVMTSGNLGPPIQNYRSAELRKLQVHVPWTTGSETNVYLRAQVH